MGGTRLFRASDNLSQLLSQLSARFQIQANRTTGSDQVPNDVPSNGLSKPPSGGFFLPLWPVQPGECVVLVVRTMDSKVGGGKMASLPAQLQTPT
jgi:hypothetical protein